MKPKLNQPTPKELVDSVMQTIREQFCQGMDAKAWFKDNFHFLRKWCITQPAKFIVSKNFTLPADRFKQILTNVITEARREALGPIQFVPAYLGKCVQSHFDKHWEEYYQEAKAIQATADHALLALGKLPIRADHTVEDLAKIHQVLVSKSRKRVVEKPEQPTLF
jgi:hypothetical protein